MATYNFGRTTFVNEVWIAGKKVFKGSINVNVEFETGGPFLWLIADDKGAEVKTVRHENAHAGWTSIDLPSLGIYGDASVGFRNLSGKEQRIKQGDLNYGN